MTTAQIKSLFVTYFDVLSFNFSNQQLNDLFSKASIIYFDNMADQYSISSEITDDLSTVISSFSFTPTSTILDTSTDPNLTSYYRVFRIKPTYVVNGKTYNQFPAKSFNPQNRNSPYSNGSLMYPKYDLLKNKIRIFPLNTIPTLVEGEYMVAPPVIDFALPNAVISLSDKNVQQIIKYALIEAGVSQRENDYVAAVSAEIKGE